MLVNGQGELVEVFNVIILLGTMAGVVPYVLCAAALLHLLLFAGVFVLFLSGLSWWWFGIAGAVGATGFARAMFAPISWFSFLRPYQQDRILTFLNP